MISGKDRGQHHTYRHGGGWVLSPSDQIAADGKLNKIWARTVIRT